MYEHGSEFSTALFLLWEDHGRTLIFNLLSLLDIMKRFKAESFFTLSSLLERLSVQAQSVAHLPVDRESTLYLINDIDARCSEVGLPLSIMFLRRMSTSVKADPPMTYHDLRIALTELQMRIADEMSLLVFLQIPQEKIGFFEKSCQEFGEDAVTRFPSVLGDVEEAGKCYAAARNTACVFHLMRVMESGLRALGVSLKASSLDPKTNPTWEKILRRCDDELKKPLASRDMEWQAEEQFFSQATANLRAVKDAWRNPTMHVERKYTEEEALEVFNAVRAFMRHLATKLNE